MYSSSTWIEGKSADKVRGWVLLLLREPDGHSASLISSRRRALIFYTPAQLRQHQPNGWLFLKKHKVLQTARGVPSAPSCCPLRAILCASQCPYGQLGHHCVITHTRRSQPIDKARLAPVGVSMHWNRILPIHKLRISHAEPHQQGGMSCVTI